MLDLQLFRQLRDRRFTPDEVIAPLEELATWPAAERLPFLGFIPPLLNHPDARVRAAACGVLAEQLGVPTFKHLVAALNDSEAIVRLAAVNALRQCWQGNDYARWVHCLFHPRADVRKASIEVGKDFPPPDWWRLYLLADPECRDEILTSINPNQIVPDAILILFGYLRQGVLPREQVREWVAKMAWHLCYAVLAQRRIRSAEEATRVFQTAWMAESHEQILPLVGNDGLDELFDLFLDAPESDRGWFIAIRNDLPSYHAETREKIVASLLVSGLARPIEVIERSSKLWLEVLVCFWPQVIEVKWLPLQLRREGLRGLYDLGQRALKFDVNIVQMLLQTPVCQREDGLLDLWSIGALLHLFESTPYKHLLKCYPLDLVRASFEVDPERAVEFLSLHDNSKQGRKFLIQELCLQPREKRTSLLALLCRVVPGDGLDFLDSITPEEACRVLESLIALKVDLSVKKSLRLAEIFARKIAGSHLNGFLRIWLSESTPADDALCLHLFGCLCREQHARFLEQAIRALSAPEILRFIARSANAPGFPYDREIGIARILVEHGEEAIRDWAAARLQSRETKASDEIDRDALLKSGLCLQLRGQTGLTIPSVSICAALLASHDLLEEVDEQFAIYSSMDPAFVKKLDAEMIRHWRNETRLPLFGQAFMYRWEENAYAFGALLEKELGFVGVLQLADKLKSELLAVRIWEAVGRVLELYHWHAKTKFVVFWKRELVEEIVAHFAVGRVGLIAARLFMQRRGYQLNHPLWDELKPLAQTSITSCSKEVLETLQPWIDTRGVVETAPSEFQKKERQAHREPTGTEADLDALIAAVQSLDAQVSFESVTRLVERGEEGRERLRQLLRLPEPIRHICHVVSHLPELFSVLEPLRDWLADETLPVHTRFRIGKKLIDLGEQGLYPELIRLISLPSPLGWFEAEDFVYLKAAVAIVGERSLAIPLALSPHPHAYEPAVRMLCDEIKYDAEIRDALIRFLELGTTRFRELRLQVAEKLYQNGDIAIVLPLLLQRSPETPPPHPQLLKGQPIEVLEAVLQALLMVGWGETAEWMLFHLLQDHGVKEFHRIDLLTRLLREATSDAVRQEIRRTLKPSFARDMKLRRIADTFAWGIRMGRQLTGKLFTIEMLTGEALGYTRFTENKIHINPLPILRSEMHGREVVRALILHEFGHHMFHKSEVGLQVWKQSEQEGLQRLLNLVSDEHLERNLRSQDRSFGDQLKLLASYAFQHTSRQLPVENLLSAMQHHAFHVLSSAPLEVAKKWGCVTILNGRILLQMEKVGLSFARFVRALRMGLGNRHDDPRVEKALQLFKDRFRKSDMPRLYEITKQLRDIFGSETDILNSFDQDACCDGDGDEIQRAGEGITNEELQEEVKKSLEGRKRTTSRDSKGGKGLNLGPEEQFDLINEVVNMPYDPARHASYSQQVQRPAMLLRKFLKQLGIGYEQERLRMSGKLFDKTRARAVVLRSDPRMLIARQLRIVTDLFIGIVIDCSGSMSNGNNIEKAKLFATLIAESARNYPGIDVRLFGFTDRQVFDCGNAGRCAVHDLEAGGGNNDAAGLYHASLAAKASKRRAKLLVMISDGSPTECTVTALRGLVQRLTKRSKMCCAQVAVCPLDHICFPHYILLDQENVDLSVRQFGTTMMKLVQQALRG